MRKVRNGLGITYEIDREHAEERETVLTPERRNEGSPGLETFGLEIGKLFPTCSSRVHSELIRFRAHVTARELASPPFEDVYVRAFADRVTPNQRRI